MIRSSLSESEIAGAERGDVLSEESERAIRQMVEEQLDRPNPPDTKVLYRRAMHFIDRDVRHLSLQQFNAKFPLQVKRQRARDRERPDRPGTRPTAEDGHSAPRDDPAGPPGGGDGRPSGDAADAPDGASGRDPGVPGRAELRDRIRSALLEYAELVAGAESRADLIEVVPRVGEYVDRVVDGA